MATTAKPGFKTMTENPEFSMVIDLAPEEVVQYLGRVHMVDVRTSDEFVGELGHIKDAELITLPLLPDHMGTLPRDKIIVFVCRSGGRSARAAAFAKQNGLEQVFNMKGGMLRWNELSLPVVS